MKTRKLNNLGYGIAILSIALIFIQCTSQKRALSYTWAVENMQFDYGASMISLNNDFSCIIPPSDSTKSYEESIWSIDGSDKLIFHSKHKILSGEFQYRFRNKQKTLLELRKNEMVLELTRL